MLRYPRQIEVFYKNQEDLLCDLGNDTIERVFPVDQRTESAGVS